MIHWMVSAHGRMPVYDKGEVERLKVHGWTLLNFGPAPLVVPVINGDTSRAPEDVLPAKGCPECGQAVGHYDDCPVGLGVVAKRKPGRPKKVR